nr:hypothetical protein [Tanacetum cinerariifolium]
GCTLLREKLEEDLVTYFQDFQNTSESPDDSTNVVNAPREPFVVKKDHGVNPPHIDECCCECGDALDGIFCQQCICKSCGKVPCVSKPNFVDESSNIFNPPPQPPIYYCEFCGSNAQYDHYCTPQALFINPEPAKDHFKIALNSNDDISSSDDDSLYNENIEYVEASPHNSELISLEAAEIVIPEVEEIKDDNLSEKLLNAHLLIANIEALKDNPTPSSEFLTKS